MKLLLISGSVRSGSTNAAVLRTVAANMPAGSDAVIYDGIADLPHFNPDDDAEGKAVPEPVAAMRAEVARADAILICTPEYAGAMPAVLKNLLEWTIGDAGTYGKPVAWINASSSASPTGGADAHESLAKVLKYAGADVVAPACARIPLSRGQVGQSGLVEDDDAVEQIRAAVRELAAHVDGAQR